MLNISIYSSDPLITAISENNPDRVRQLLDEGADPTKESSYSCHEIDLNGGINSEVRGERGLALVAAAKKGNQLIVTELLRRYPTLIKLTENVVLHESAPNCISILLDYGASLSTLNSVGSTPLYHQVAAVHELGVEALLKYNENRLRPIITNFLLADLAKLVADYVGHENPMCFIGGYDKNTSMNVLEALGLTNEDCDLTVSSKTKITKLLIEANAKVDDIRNTTSLVDELKRYLFNKLEKWSECIAILEAALEKEKVEKASQVKIIEVNN